MWLQRLSLLNFKNYAEAELRFSPSVNAFTGNNGAGKTNLLDAIHYLSLCKSYFNPIDSQSIRMGADVFMIQGEFERNGRQEVISVGLKRNQKKQFRRNKKEYSRLADHIGLFPLVMVTPNDSCIITEGSEERRKFVDNVISQTDPNYLDELIVYNRNLLARNTLLKQIAETGKYDPALLEIYDDQLVASGSKLFNKRQQFLEIFTGIFNRHYLYLTDSAEEVQLVYDSPLIDQDFAELIRKSVEKDRALQRTTVGIHKDDLVFTIHGMPLKKFGSQGQQKSFLIALKLAQYTYLDQQKGFRPLLLLDDIFDKLDDRRTRKLMEMVSAHDFGQIFITDTNRERIQTIFEEIKVAVQIFDVEHGNISGYAENE